MHQPFLCSELSRADQWHFKKSFLQTLVDDVPRILKGEDKKTGRFGQGIWIVTEQNCDVSAVGCVGDEDRRR